MNTRVIFLDDEPQTHRQLKDLLLRNGYEVRTPGSLEEALAEINRNGAEVLIHGAHGSRTHWTLCEQIFKEYPKFPSLHIASGPTAEMGHGVPGGPFHQRARPLMPEKEFLRRLRKLVFMGRLSRENVSLHRSMKIHKRLDVLFDSLDPAELKSQVVRFFQEEFKAKNVYFVNSGSYKYFLEEMWKVTPLNKLDDDTRSNFNNIVSAVPSSEKELTAYIKEANRSLPSSWESNRARQFIQESETGKTSFCFLPVIGHQSKRILGHVLMVNPLLYGDQGLERAMPYLNHVVGRHLEHVMTFAHTKGLSYIDDLTELYNQRYLRLVLDKEIARSRRIKSGFSVLFMDIDHFKQVNDTRGHLIGSKVLVEVSKILHQNIRSSDYGFRYGGDEFLMILVGTGTKQAELVAERIRRQVQDARFNIDGRRIQLTMSIGIASFPDHATTKEQIIELADRAMYCGKNKSRNVVYVAS